MEKLDNLVAGHIEHRLLAPERLEEVLASVLDRRQERTERRREHIAELNKRAAETDLRLKRLYDAIETGVADLGDPGLKERIAGLKAIRDQARPTPCAPRPRLKTQLSNPSPRRCYASSQPRPASGCGSKAAAIAATICVPWPRESRLPTARSASWDRRAICSERSPPFRA